MDDWGVPLAIRKPLAIVECSATKARQGHRRVQLTTRMMASAISQNLDVGENI